MSKTNRWTHLYRCFTDVLPYVTGSGTELPTTDEEWTAALTRAGQIAKGMFTEYLHT